MGVIQVETFDVDVTSEGQNFTLANALPSTEYGFVRNTNPRGHSGGPVGSTANSGPDDMSGYAYVSSTTQLTLGRQLGTHKVVGEVWRYTGAPGGVDEFIVRDRLQVTLTNAGPVTTAVSGVVDRNKCICFITGKTCTQSNQNNMAEMGAIAFLDVNGDLVVERGTGTSTLVVYVTVVEFTGDNWTVAYGKTSFSSGAKNLYLDSRGDQGAQPTIDWTSAFLAEIRQAGGNGSNDAIEDISFVAEAGDSNTFVQTVDSTGANTGSGFVHVLQNGAMNVARTMASRSISNNNTYFNETFPVGITLSDVSESCLEWSVFSDGGGTAHGRGSLCARLTSATNIQSWVHRNGNSAQYRYGVIDLANVLGIAAVTITSAPTQIDVGDQNLTISGDNFISPQGGGNVYISDSPVLGSAAEVIQPTDSWSDTNIQFDADLSGLSDGIVYIIVENDEGATAAWVANKGVPSYTNVILGLSSPPNHYHTFNNTYADEIGGLAANSQASAGTQGFFAEPLSRGRTHSWGPTGSASRIEMTDSQFTNITTTHRRRFIGGWFRFPSVPLDPKGIWEEGGNVNNIYMVIGFGGRLLCNVADSSNGFTLQAFSDFLLTPNRTYHIGLLFGGISDDNGCFCYIDGVRQNGSSGVPTSVTQATHSGDYSYGQPDGSLDTGGTDIDYPSFSGSRYNDWATWVSPPDGDIRTEVFEKGAREDIEIASGTPANMQAAVDALSGSLYLDTPFAIKVSKPIGAADLNLDFGNITFGDRASIQVMWMGSNGATLTITNRNGSNVDASRCSTPFGGIISVINPSVLTLTGIQDGSEVRVLSAGTTNEIGGEEAVSGGVFTADIDESSVDIVVHSLGFLNQRLSGVDTTENVSLPIQQRVDRQYENA